MKALSKTNLGILVAISAAFIFGISTPAMRAVYATGGNTAFILLLATFARTAAMTFFCLWSKKTLFKTRKDVTAGFFGGIFQAVSGFGIFMSLNYLPGPVMIVIIFSHTLMLLFFMAWKKEVRLDIMTVATAIAALAGLTMALDLYHQDHYSLIGIALAFIAALSLVGRFYLYGQQTKHSDPALVGAESFLFACLLTLPILFFQIPVFPDSTIGWGWAFLCTASSVIGTFCMLYGISLIGAFRYSMTVKLEPLFTSLFSIILIGEILNPTQYFGIAIVILSLAAYQYHAHRLEKRNQ